MTPEDNVKKYKSQPWILFYKVVARSFLLGDSSDAGKAVGSNDPAVSNAGEIVFFSGGLTKGANPWYTNMDVSGQLAYGMEVWQAYLAMHFPPDIGVQSLIEKPNDENLPQRWGAPGLMLAHLLLNFSVLELNLGQELQIEFPTHRLPAGGGIVNFPGMFSMPQNGFQFAQNVLRLPEPIEMVKSQNITAKLRIAPQVHKLIGTPDDPGVGGPLDQYSLVIPSGEEQETVTRPMPPYVLELGLVGRRVKMTHYGQTGQ